MRNLIAVIFATLLTHLVLGSPDGGHALLDLNNYLDKITSAAEADAFLRFIAASNTVPAKTFDYFRTQTVNRLWQLGLRDAVQNIAQNYPLRQPVSAPQNLMPSQGTQGAPRNSKRRPFLRGGSRGERPRAPQRDGLHALDNDLVTRSNFVLSYANVFNCFTGYEQWMGHVLRQFSYIIEQKPNSKELVDKLQKAIEFMGARSDRLVDTSECESVRAEFGACLESLVQLEKEEGSVKLLHINDPE